MSAVPEYTVTAVLSLLVVLGIERFWWRTGVFGELRFWLSMAIVMAFQVPVDGWLTKLSDPIVLYDAGEMTGWRFVWDIQVEDFVYGFAMVSLTIMWWVRLGRRDPAPRATDTDTDIGTGVPTPSRAPGTGQGEAG